MTFDEWWKENVVDQYSMNTREWRRSRRVAEAAWNDATENALANIPDPAIVPKLIEAARVALEWFHTQEKRESEEFHIPSHTMRAMMEDTKNRLEAALKEIPE